MITDVYMNFGVRVRLAVFDDLAAYESLIADAETAEASGISRETFLNDAHAAIQRAEQGWLDGMFLLFALVSQGEVKGFAQIAHTNGVSWIGYMVERSSRRQGFAKQLVSEVIKFCYGVLQTQKIWAEVNGDNLYSKKVLEANRFHIKVRPTTTPDSEELPAESEIYVRKICTNSIGAINMDLQNILYAYARIKKIAPITLSESGTCRLRFLENLDVDIEQSHDTHRCHIYAIVADIPASADVTWYQNILSLNLFGRDSGFAALACSQSTKHIILSWLVDLEVLSPEQFTLRFDEFARSLSFLRDRVRDLSTVETTKASEADVFNMIRV